MMSGLVVAVTDDVVLEWFVLGAGVGPVVVAPVVVEAVGVAVAVAVGVCREGEPLVVWQLVVALVA